MSARQTATNYSKRPRTAWLIPDNPERYLFRGFEVTATDMCLEVVGEKLGGGDGL